MTPIRAVLFDYGMVLSGPPDATATARMERLLDVPPAQLQQAYWRYRDAYDRGALSGTAYWASVAASLARPATPELIAELIAADTALWTQPNLPMIAWAAALQQAGVRTGILSNLGDAMEAGIRSRLPWLEAFHHHTFSHHLGIAKPDTAIYRHAIAGINLPPQEILFVDDREDNILAARAAGMQAVHYSTHEAFCAAMRADGFSGLLMPGL